MIILLIALSLSCRSPDNAIGVVEISLTESWLYQSPDFDSKKLVRTHRGEQAYLYNYYNYPFAKIQYKGLTGYISLAGITNYNFFTNAYNIHPQLKRIQERQARFRGTKTMMLWKIQKDSSLHYYFYCPP